MEELRGWRVEVLRYWDRAGGAVAAVGLGMRKGDGGAGGVCVGWGECRRTVLCFFRSHSSSREELSLFSSTRSVLHFIKLS